jgi:proteasome accessory factor C
VTRPSSAQRLGRLLAIVPWVVSHEGPTIREVCHRFAISERELLADLDLLFMCGVYPFTPDALIEVDIEDGRVWIRFAEWFRRPLRLTPAEALALVAAGRAVLAMAAASESERAAARPIGVGQPGHGPPVVPAVRGHAQPDAASKGSALASALAKLEMVIGAGGDEGLDVELGDAPAEVLGALQRAVAQRRKVRLEYYSFGRDETGTRVVQPWRVFSSEGQWYMQAWCEKVGGERLFRVDRVRSATPLQEPFQPPRAAGLPRIYESRDGDPLVVLDLSPPARWIAERYPNEGVEDTGRGVIRVKLRASSKAWLERLLLRAGPHAKVVSGAEGVAEAAARRLLARYGGY